MPLQELVRNVCRNNAHHRGVACLVTVEARENSTYEVVSTVYASMHEQRSLRPRERRTAQAHVERLSRRVSAARLEPGAVIIGWVHGKGVLFGAMFAPATNASTIEPRSQTANAVHQQQLRHTSLSKLLPSE